jgi:prepilin-type processing-associated H-X9-DG protein
MKQSSIEPFPCPPGCHSHASRRFHFGVAFTLIELLVVIGTLAVLSVLFLPALAGSRAQPKVTACSANFRQWAVTANLYAADNSDRLPSFSWSWGGGSYLWDVSPLSVSNLAPYGVTVPMWFDPVRPAEFEMAQARYQQIFGADRRLVTITDLSLALAANSYNEALIDHNVWVPRNGMLQQPNIRNPATEPAWMQGTPVGKYGYPYRLHSSAAAHVPFISCKACSSTDTTAGMGAGFLLLSIVPPASGIASTNPTNTCPNTAHFVNGVLQGVNAAYADGHVETHNQANMLCGYATFGTMGPYWFY